MYERSQSLPQVRDIRSRFLEYLSRISEAFFLCRKGETNAGPLCHMGETRDPAVKLLPVAPDGLVVSLETANIIRSKVNVSNPACHVFVGFFALSQIDWRKRLSCGYKSFGASRRGKNVVFCYRNKRKTRHAPH